MGIRRAGLPVGVRGAAAAGKLPNAAANMSGDMAAVATAIGVLAIALTGAVLVVWCIWGVNGGGR